MNNPVVRETKCAPIILIYQDILLMVATLRLGLSRACLYSCCCTLIFSSSMPFLTTIKPKNPLVLKPPNYLVTSSDLTKWHGWAKTLASSAGSSFVESDNGPDPTLLCKELSWLLEDSLENSSYSSRACPFPSINMILAVKMRISLYG